VTDLSKITAEAHGLGLLVAPTTSSNLAIILRCEISASILEEVSKSAKNLDLFIIPPFLRFSLALPT